MLLKRLIFIFFNDYFLKKRSCATATAVMRSAFFREEMKKAFTHGREFEQLETDSDMDVANFDDKHLPFYEWFAKHYA